MELTKEIFDSGVRTVAIFGETGSGKTSLAYKLIDILRNERKVFFFRHPKPELIEELGYINLDSLEQMEEAQDCVLYLDEPQLHLSIYNKKSNQVIANICSLARQLNIILIISSSDTRVFTKHNEAYFDLWLIKDLDYQMVKNGSRIKDILRKNTRFDPSGLRLKRNEFLADSRKVQKLNGKHKFEEVEYFSNAHSRPYYNEDNGEKIDEENKNSEEKTEEKRSKSKVDIEIFTQRTKDERH